MLQREVSLYTSGIKANLPDMKWVGQENLHITVKFLGEVKASSISKISSVALKASRHLPAFNICLSNLGAFPNASRAKVLWWGLGEGATNVSSLFQTIDSALSLQGFSTDKKRFHPHITLARLRIPSRLSIESFNSPSGLSFSCLKFQLYQSTLTPQGPIYNVIEEFKLA